MTGNESMAEWRITVEILRYRPEQDTAPVVQSYEIPCVDDMLTPLSSLGIHSESSCF